MIGDQYWSTGIVLRAHENADGQICWGAKADFFDDGFADDDADAGVISTQGEVATRYMTRPGDQVDALTAAIDAVRRDAERLGIQWREMPGISPALHVPGDGERADVWLPDDWRDLVTAQAERLGWRSPYRANEVA